MQAQRDDEPERGMRFRVRACSRSSRANERSNGRVPPFHPFREARALPSAVVGPVECFHGCH